MKILSALLISAFALRVASGIAFTNPTLASNYEPPDNGSPDGIIGSGTRVFDCTYRGSDRKEGCL